ncbi:MAG: hypothetical protein IJO97_00605 [Lachnospiraceae bacterium]|nr:hypothetical protein [Lachnospiraceae bacterium]
MEKGYADIEKGSEESYYELEGNDAHSGATYYDSEVLNIIQEFCEKHTVYQI